MKNIVIIKDSDSDFEEIKTILEFNGFVVHPTANELQGLDLIRRINPDLVICFSVLSDMDRQRILLNLKKSPDTSSIPFIFITPRSSRLEIHGIKLESNIYLHRPFTSDVLIQAVQKQLEKKDIISKKLQEEIISENEDINNSYNFDPVTGLPREVILEDWIEDHLNNGEANSKYCLYLIELNNLTDLIHSLGVHAGEYIFQTIAERINNFVGDMGILFKPENFDYGVLLDLKILEDENIFSEKLLDLIKQELNFQGLNLFITGNIGYCKHDSNSASYNSMIAHSQKALKQANLNGMNHAIMYTPSLNILLSLQENLEEYIQRAIDKNEFSIIYQPLASFTNNEIIGAEALIRWNHAGYGNINPSQFIPIAEKTGSIVKLGEWILKKVVFDIIELSEIFEFPPSISVNVSALQIQEESFIYSLKNSLEENPFPPDKLIIEISEIMLTTDTKKILKILHKIKELGLKISIDDFGTGFSSLAFLKQFPFDSIKLDKSLIKNLSMKTVNPVIGSIINMAEKTRLQIIAEGVETIMQKDLLKDLGCHQFQGYLLSKPIELKDFYKIYEKNQKSRIIV